MTRYLLVEFIRNFKRDYKHREDGTFEIDCYFCRTYLMYGAYRNFQDSVLRQYNGEQIYCKMCYDLFTKLKSERCRKINL